MTFSLFLPFPEPSVFSWKTERIDGIRCCVGNAATLTNYHRVLVRKHHEVLVPKYLIVTCSFSCLRITSFLLYSPFFWGGRVLLLLFFFQIFLTLVFSSMHFSFSRCKFFSPFSFAVFFLRSLHFFFFQFFLVQELAELITPLIR